MDLAFVGALADRLSSDQRRDMMQLIVDEIERIDHGGPGRLLDLRAFNPLHALLPIVDKFDARQKERVLQSVTNAVRAFGRPRETVSTLAGFSRMQPDALDRIDTALVQRLESSRSAGSKVVDINDILATMSEVRGATVPLAGLWDLLKWPTLSDDAYIGIVNEIAHRERVSPMTMLRAKVLRSSQSAPASSEPQLEPNRWALSAWAAKRRLDLAPLPRPAGYD
jgi:hypothetical protein